MTTMAAMLAGVPMMLAPAQAPRYASHWATPSSEVSPCPQVLTLYTTPVVYIYLDRLQSWLFGRKKPAIEDNARWRRPNDGNPDGNAWLRRGADRTCPTQIPAIREFRCGQLRST